MITIIPIIALTLPLVIAVSESPLIQKELNQAESLVSGLNQKESSPKTSTQTNSTSDSPSVATSEDSSETKTSKAKDSKKDASKANEIKGPKTIKTLHGKASWYEIKCNGGTQTASGIPLKDHAMTAAHKTLPMGTMVRVTNNHNGKSAIVKITDRGPYIKGRVIDVTKGVAKKLDFINTGVVRCKVEVLEK